MRETQGRPMVGGLGGVHRRPHNPLSSLLCAPPWPLACPHQCEESRGMGLCSREGRGDRWLGGAGTGMGVQGARGGRGEGTVAGDTGRRGANRGMGGKGQWGRSAFFFLTGNLLDFASYIRIY